MYLKWDLEQFTKGLEGLVPEKKKGGTKKESAGSVLALSEIQVMNLEGSYRKLSESGSQACKGPQHCCKCPTAAAKAFLSVTTFPPALRTSCPFAGRE